MRQPVADYTRDLRPAKWGSEVRLRGSNPDPLMSALGHKQTFALQKGMSALPPKATEIADIVDAEEGQNISAPPCKFRRRLAPLW